MMGVAEAKKYIQELHRKQDNPYLWPDFLTGLPDKGAIIRKLDEVYPRLGKFSIAYVRIANIHPYLLKYGPDKHADIIQWAAAILKTTYDKCPSSLVGAMSTHDFIIICETGNMTGYLREAARIFKKKAETFYSAEDLKRGTVLSFARDGKRINIGFMRFAAVVVNRKPLTGKNRLLQDMGRLCEMVERTSEDVVVMNGGKCTRKP